MLDLAAIKKRQQQIWAAGDFSMIGVSQVIVSELLRWSSRQRARLSHVGLCRGALPRGWGKIAFVFPIRYTTQPGYGIHGMPDNPDTPVQLQRVGGIFQGGYGARIPGTSTPRAGKRRKKD